MYVVSAEFLVKICDKISVFNFLCWLAKTYNVKMFLKEGELKWSKMVIKYSLCLLMPDEKAECTTQ